MAYANVAPRYGAERLTVGDTPLLSCVFTIDSAALATATLRNGDTLSVEGVLTDPTTVSLTVYKPDGSSNTYTYALTTVAKFATGVFDKADYVADQAGDYIAVWTATGTVVDTDVARFTVFSTAENLYCSVESLKSRFGITDTADDFELERVVRAASRRIESYTGRGRFWRDTAVTTRTFHADSSNSVRVPLGISTATGLIVKTDEDGDNTFERTLTVDTDFLLRPSDALTDGWPFDEIVLADNYYFPLHSNGRAGVQITARFGWPNIPADVSEACLILAHRLFKRKETATGVVGFDGMGATVRLSSTDPDVAELLAPYRVVAVG